MTRETLKRVIVQTFAYQRDAGRSGKCDFIWHGGEPLVPGLGFYREVVELQREFSHGHAFDNTMQTNGILINDDWIDFFRKEDFRVSVSIDGPRHLNDQTRIDLRGRGTFERVSKSFAALKAAGVPFGVCVVLTKANVDHVGELMAFLKAERLPFNVIPLTLSGSAKDSFTDLGLGPDQYAEPWIKLYDAWFDSKPEDYVYCSDFAHKTHAIMSGRPADCIGQKNCSAHHVSTDPDGWVYPCATLSGDTRWAYGNVNDSSLTELLESSVAVEAKARTVDPQCAECKWQHVCHGGCMQRAFKFTGDHNQRDYYCPSLFEMYEHVERRLRDDGRVDQKNMPASRATTVSRVQPVS